MNIFTTVISGGIEQMFQVLSSEQNLLIMTDSNVIKLDKVQSFVSSLDKQGYHYTLVSDLPAEPTNLDVESLLDTLPENVDAVVGIGGGSVLDISKLISVLYASPSENLACFNRLLEGETPESRIPLVLVPTTAGTGAEATPNSIIAIPERATKVGIISPVMLPDYVALVPELTTSMPAHITASTGIDALCHLIECYTASVANPVGDNYALIGMQKFFANIEQVIETPEDLMVRLNLLWASYYGGASISHSGTHLVHALSYPLGGKYKIPHGLANSLLLVPVMKHIYSHCEEKLANVYRLLPSANLELSEAEMASALVDYLENLVQKLGLPTYLNDIGIEREQLPELAASAMQVTRLLNHSPVKVSEQDVLELYQSITK
ncbi:iron-containing alcohol dehydrogenase [Vibrio sp. STUT-A11]|uniref:iron-containing alcohol dehydrogenase n=1 Tax=unclassified Vibrio TaxID=2614977 RepID=UPI0022301CDE|nr:iron-containing alcohol dehydrogenase [Vibrio sp. STUT-A11]BDR15083.1 alcohol dehydrogenase [Vibrio sp. STUT-A11]